LIGFVSQLFGLKLGFIACGVLGLLALGLMANRDIASHKIAA